MIVVSVACIVENGAFAGSGKCREDETSLEALHVE